MRPFAVAGALIALLYAVAGLAEARTVVDGAGRRVRTCVPAGARA